MTKKTFDTAPSNTALLAVGSSVSDQNGRWNASEYNAASAWGVTFNNGTGRTPPKTDIAWAGI